MGCNLCTIPGMVAVKSWHGPQGWAAVMFLTAKWAIGVEITRWDGGIYTEVYMFEPCN